MNDGSSTPIDLDHPDKGLLSKIIYALIKQPVDSIYRFWLASCVEAFLRRATSSAQLFVARTPLLHALADEIFVGGAYRSQGSFQSAFDLLGEMTKGNWLTLQLFHGLLSNTQFAAFMGTYYMRLLRFCLWWRMFLTDTFCTFGHCRSGGTKLGGFECVYPVDAAVVREVCETAHEWNIWSSG